MDSLCSQFSRVKMVPVFSTFGENLDIGVVFTHEIIDGLFQDGNIYCKNLISKFTSLHVKKVWYKNTTKQFYIFGGNSNEIRFRVFLEIARKILKIRYILGHGSFTEQLVYINKLIFDVDIKLGLIWREKVGAIDPEFAKKYMEKYQWVDGEPLGKTMKGRLTPVSDDVKVKTNRFGLGYLNSQENQPQDFPQERLRNYPAIYLPETKKQYEKDYPSTTFVKSKHILQHGPRESV